MATPGAKRVGVFVKHSIEEIHDIMDEACLDMAQLHGDQGLEVAWALGADRVIKVFWPERHSREELLTLMILWKDLAAYFLFDAGTSGGGSGNLIQSVLPDSPKPYFLAGGLNPILVKTFWPSKDPMLAGFDLNSGLEESPGLKNSESLKSFLPWR
jgi:phosphoribosylanthranilate isomerase